MKENVLDVLMYLFETFSESAEDEPEPDRNELKMELERAGFRDREIDRALDWLDGLNAAEIPHEDNQDSSGALRIYDPFEQVRLNARARGYLLYLEQAGILSPDQRELGLVITRIAIR